MRRRPSFALVLAVSLCCSVVTLGASAAPVSAARTRSPLTDDAITVGSFNFAESALLAEVYSQALEHGGYQVKRAFRLGPREFVAPAFRSGLVELVPDYSGTTLQFVTLGKVAASTSSAATHDALVEALDGEHTVVLDSAPAQDANTFVVRPETADQFNLQTLSDLAVVAPVLTFGGPPECRTRPLCLAGLERVYGITKFKEFVELDAGGPITKQALTNRDVDAALLFTTDPAIGNDFVELTDDRALQPAENVTPLLRKEVSRHFGPRLAALLNRVSRHLTTEKLRDMNARVAKGRKASEVAARWLGDEKLR